MGDRIIPLPEEKEKKKDLDILEFLGKLEWLRDAELENQKPFDTTKLRTPHIFFVMFQGAKYALSLHGTAILMGLLIVIFTFISKIFFYLSFLIEILLLLIKIAFPIYVIRSFVIWENSLMTKLVENFVLGYSLTSFIVDMISLLISFIAFVFLKVLSAYPQLQSIAEIGFLFFNKKTAIIWFINVICDFIPIFYFHIYKKQKKFHVPRWTPLDEIPD